MNRAAKLVTVFILTFSVEFQWFAFPPTIPKLIETSGISFSQAGSLVSILALSFVIAIFPLGLLQDILKSRWLFILGLVLTAIGTSIRGVVPTFESFAVGHMILGVGVAIAWIRLPGIVTEWFDKREAGFANGVFVLGWPVGIVAAFTITPTLFAILPSWEFAFVIYGFAMVAVTVSWAFLDYMLHISKSESLKSVVKANLASRIRIIISSKDLWILGLIYLGMIGIYSGILTWLPTILKLRGSDLIFSVLLTAIVPGSFALGTVFWGSLSDRIRLRKPFVYLPSTMVVPAAFFSFTSEGFILQVIGFLLGFGSGYVALLYTILNESPTIRDHVASASGFITSVGTAGSIIMPFAIGYVADVTGSFSNAAIPLIAISVSIPILTLAIRETGSRKVTVRSH